SPPVRKALSSRLKLRHLRKLRVQRKDSDISSGIGLHVPSLSSIWSPSNGTTNSSSTWHFFKLDT
ncbi:hypothetical protein Tco_0297602, partial [Tanacetum coccineum]